MKLIIEEWWNKVVDDPTEPRFGRRVLPKFERKSRTVSPNGGGWSDENEWRKSIRKTKGFVGFTPEGAAKIRLHKSWGIELWQLVFFADDNYTERSFSYGD